MAFERTLVRLCLWLALLLCHGAAMACQVCVVASDKSAAFQEAYDTLGQELGRGGGARPSVALLTVAQFQDGGAAVQEARLLVTLGTEALRQVLARNSKTPVLAGLIPRISLERVLADSPKRAPGSVGALYLDQPFGRQLDLLRLALPHLHRVGVLWGPESIRQQPLMASALQVRGLEVSEGQFTDGQGMITALQAALADAEVLVAVADAAVYNANTVSNILISSYRAKVPVLAFSPAYVKAGALLSVHSTASQLGGQMAVMATYYLQNNTMPPAALQYPAEFTVTVNDYVARSLGLALDARALSDKLHRQERRP